MLRGGSMIAGGNHMPQFDVPKVDVVAWIERSFGVADFVVLKMDVEGAEAEIVPKLLATNATRLVDVFLWECHAKWKGVKGKCQCWTGYGGPDWLGIRTPTRQWMRLW